jgi:hypothetical protein
MKLHSVAVVGVLAALALSACGSPARQSVPTAASIEVDSSNAAFLQELDKNGIAYSSPQAAYNLGHSVCSALASGATPMAVVSDIEAVGHYPSTTTYTIVGASIGAYCIDQQARINE